MIPTLFIILDGFGLADPSLPGNAITPKTAPHIFEYLKKYPSTTLTAHGSAVGLFPDQEGNSEAGHFTIGAGRLVEQDLVRISKAIHDGTFFKNEAFKQALFHAKKYQAAVHVMGLLTDEQSAHAYPEHLYALLDYFAREKCGPVYLHLFTDGRDSSPHAALTYLSKLRTHMTHGEIIATVTGRFYVMDRNKIWERTKKAYDAMVVGEGCTAPSAEEAIEQAYNRGETDEYICPTVIETDGKPVAAIGTNDVIFFFNARSDRARQITKAFVQKDFEHMNGGTFTRRSYPGNIRFVAMTDFGPDLPGIFTAFPSPDVPNSLAKAIGEQYRQLYISESEKYAHVTYFINGGYAEPINGEKRELIRSPKTYSYADKPAMNVKELRGRILTYVKKDEYDFICVNFPNADMVGHTGNLKAAKKAVAILDKEVARLTTAMLKKGGQVILTADHGNAEEMINPRTGEMDTEHTVHPVPFVIIRKGLTGTLRKNGTLQDVAPTVLHCLGITPPPEMTGISLL